MVGSQLVGLVPLKALLDAAAFYCDKEKLFVLEEEHRIRLVGCACFWERDVKGGMGAVGLQLLQDQAHASRWAHPKSKTLFFLQFLCFIDMCVCMCVSSCVCVCVYF